MKRFVLLFLIMSVGLPVWAQNFCTHIAMAKQDTIKEGRPWRTGQDSDPAVGQAYKVWDKVFSVFKGLYPNYAGVVGSRERTSLVVLAQGLRDPYTNHEFAPYAITCGPEGRVYVTYALVRQVFMKHEYPVEFFAFVMGHELGHRRWHFKRDGRLVEGVKGGLETEKQADRTGAMLTTMAGYRVKPISNQGMISRIVHVVCPDLKNQAAKRESDLAALLVEYDNYERVFEVASSFYFIGAYDMARRLLGIAYKGMQVSEVTILHADVVLAELQGVLQSYGPKYGLAGPFYAMAGECERVVPTHTAMRQFEHQAMVMGSDNGRDVELRRARKMLEDIRARMNRTPPPAPSFSYFIVRGCVSYYLRDFDRARADFKDADRIAATTQQQSAAKQNLARAKVGAYLVENPKPKGQELKQWQKQLHRVVIKAYGQKQGKDVLKMLSGRLKTVKSNQKHVNCKVCPEITAALPSVPDIKGLSDCPSRYKKIGSIPARTGSRGPMMDGILFCQAGSGTILTVIRLDDGAKKWAVVSKRLDVTGKPCPHRVGATSTGARPCCLNGVVTGKPCLHRVGATASGYEVCALANGNSLFFVKDHKAVMGLVVSMW